MGKYGGHNFPPHNYFLGVCIRQRCCPFSGGMPHCTPFAFLLSHFTRLGLCALQYPVSLLMIIDLQACPDFVTPLQGGCAVAVTDKNKEAINKRFAVFIVFYFYVVGKCAGVSYLPPRYYLANSRFLQFFSIW